MIASCTKERGWWRAWHAEQLGRDRGGRQLRKNLQITVANKAFWNRSQTVFPESSAHATFMLRALCRGILTVAIIGGSTSAGGGSASGCWPRKHPCGSKCCGPSYLAWLSEWFWLEHNVSMHMHNGAQGGTGPDFAYRCLESLVGGPQLGGQVDLVLIEFAINEESNCLKSGPRMELLLQRVHAWAPSAAVIFLNTFSVHNEIDASRCFVPLARHFGHASLSLQDAVKPQCKHHLRRADLAPPQRGGPSLARGNSGPVPGRRGSSSHPAVPGPRPSREGHAAAGIGCGRPKTW